MAITFTFTNHPTMISTEELKDIHDRYFILVFCHVNSLVGNFDESEDLTATAFVALYRMKYPIIGKNNIKAFLLKTARENTINYLKNKIAHV